MAPLAAVFPSFRNFLVAALTFARRIWGYQKVMDDERQKQNHSKIRRLLCDSARGNSECVPTRGELKEETDRLFVTT